MVWTLFYYNSLPEMPEGCSLFSGNVMHRDMLMCNPTNTGHYKYPKFETLSYDTGCHNREVEKFLRQNDREKYIIFYTRYTALNRKSRSKIVGYFKVGWQFTKPRLGFAASESVLLPMKDCIEINYSGRGVPVSWGQSQVREEIEDVLQFLQTCRATPQNISDLYRQETRTLVERLQSPSGRQEVIKVCEGCRVKNQCYWGRKTRRQKEEKLEHLYAGEQRC